jgi:hypothetical protein
VLLVSPGGRELWPTDDGCGSGSGFRRLALNPTTKPQDTSVFSVASVVQLRRRNSGRSRVSAFMMAEPATRSGVRLWLAACLPLLLATAVGAAMCTARKAPSPALVSPDVARVMPVREPEPDALRQQGVRACETGAWAQCLDLLEQARRLDPDGDAVETVQSWRERARLHASEPESVPIPTATALLRKAPDPMTGERSKRIGPAPKPGCACAALDPACACLPLNPSCPVARTSEDVPCRFF